MTVTLPIKARNSADKKASVDLKESIPAVVYGPTHTSESAVVDRKEFEKLFKTAGESTVITLTGLKESVDVLVKGVAFAPVKGGIIHVDFYVLEKGKEIVTHIPVHFIGESPASDAGAMVNKVLHEVLVSCLAAHLPSHLDVDLALLKVAGDQIHVSDISVPTGVTIKTDGEEVIAISEEIIEVVETEPAIGIEDIEVEKKGKAEPDTETASA